MNQEDFEKLLEAAVSQLRKEVQKDSRYHAPDAFEKRVREVLAKVAGASSVSVKDSFRPNSFPDIPVNGFGVEVKSTRSNSWNTTANSVLETMRERSVKKVYLIFGKMGGKPDVRWRDYEDSIHHVRISHAPRFCVNMDRQTPSLFAELGISYDDFASKSAEDKMSIVRGYARKRLRPGEKLWWLEDKEHSIEMNVRRYSHLEGDEKKRLRAESAVLCPQIVAPMRAQGKYDAALQYLITYHGILANRDMFTAGSVGMRDGKRGGGHIRRQFADIEDEMMKAFRKLDPALFKEYWGRDDIPDSPAGRLRIWLGLADDYAAGEWKPSKELFKSRR